MRNLPDLKRGDWQEYVRRIRETTKLKPGKLAELAGVSPETWWRWENRGQKPKDVQVAYRVAVGFQLDLREVLWAAGLAVDEPSAEPERDPRLDGLDPDDPVARHILGLDVDNEMKQLMLNRHRDNLERDRQRYIEQVQRDVEFWQQRRQQGAA